MHNKLSDYPLTAIENPLANMQLKLQYDASNTRITVELTQFNDLNSKSSSRVLNIIYVKGG
jgi:hypothetical protein